MNTKLKLLSLSMLTVILTACGGGSDSSSADNTQGNNQSSSQSNNQSDKQSKNKFTKKATWKVNASKIGSVCFDFDANQAVTCDDGKAWDLKLQNKGRSRTLWTNSGTSGKGKGGAFGLQNWSDMKKFSSATTSPESNRNISRHYKADSTTSVFGENKWYEYNLQGRHQLYPNYNVYLITTDNSNTSSTSSVQMPIYAMQVINYYDNNATSGHPSIRWIDTAVPTKVNTATIDASAHSKWVYFNFKSGIVTQTDDWQVAFKRNNIKLNGGDSGNGKVGGYLAKSPTGFYDADGKPVTEKFIADNAKTTETDLTDTANFKLPADGVPWMTDTFSSSLNPAYTGKYPNLDYGWYTYSGVTHQLSAKSEADAKGAFIRSGDGNSYARVRLAQINNDTSEWTFEFDVQPSE